MSLVLLHLGAVCQREEDNFTKTSGERQEVQKFACKNSPRNY